MRGLKNEAKVEEWLQHCRTNDIFVASAQETWQLGTAQYENSEWLLLSHGSKTKLSNRGSLGLMFALSPAARKAWKDAGSEVTDYGLRIMAIRLKLMDDKGKHITIKLVNAYAPTSASTEEDIDGFYDQLNLASQTSESEILILHGDFNASLGTRLPSSLGCEDQVRGTWGIKHQNKRGLMLHSWLAQASLCSATSFFRHKGKRTSTTWINPSNNKEYQNDYFFVKRRDLKRVINAHVAPHIGVYSDHTAVIMSMRVARNCKKKQSSEVPKKTFIDRSKLRKDKDALQLYCDIVNSSWNMSSADKYNKFTALKDAIKEADEKCCTSERKGQPNWFQAECIMPLVKARNEAQAKFNLEVRKARRDDPRVVEAKARLCKARSAVHKAVDAAKKDWLKGHLDSINAGPGRGCKAYWEAIKTLKKGLGNTKPAVVIKMQKSDGSQCTTDKESAKVFEAHFVKLYNTTPLEVPFEQEMVDKIAQRTIRPELGAPPSRETIVRHVKATKIGKAPGENGIPAEVYKALITDDGTLGILEEIVTDFWASEEAHEDWLTGRLKVLPKKGNLKDPNNWRGIMLLDIGAKIVASIISERLQDLLEEVGMECQNGFSRLRGCADAGYTLKAALQKLREHQQDSWVVFVDLAKAFDTVNRKALFQILRKFGVPKKLASLIEQLHTGVTVKLTVGDADVTFPAEIGVKQGDNMAPILFLFYMQAATEAMERDWPVHKPQFKTKMDGILTGRRFTTRGLIFDFWASLYADDGGFLFESRKDLGLGCNCIFATLRAFGLQMHVKGKTEAMYIPAQLSSYSTADRSNLEVSDPSGGVVGFVPFTDVFRYLGTHIHYSLSDEYEVKHRIAAASAAFGALSSMLCSRRTEYTRRGQIYKTLVLPILAYGSEYWAYTQALAHKIQSFHNKCVRRMCRVTLKHTHKHRITASSLEERLGLRDIQTMLDDHRLRWIGHVARMPQQRLPRRMLTAWVAKKRPVGRPRQATAHCYLDTLRRADAGTKWVAHAQHRDEWRERCSNVRPRFEQRGKRKPKIGKDGQEERCTNCGLPGYDESKLGPLAICDDEHCTHVFHARCIGTLSVVPRVTRLSDLPDPWYCPRCTLADMSEKRARPAQPPPPPTAPAHPTQLPPAPIAPTAAPFTIGAPGVRRSSRLAGRPPASS